MNGIVSYPVLSERQKVQFRERVTDRIRDCEESGHDLHGNSFDHQDAQALTMAIGFILDDNAKLSVMPSTIIEHYIKAHRTLFPEGNSSTARAKKNVKLLIDVYAECNPIALALLEANAPAEQQRAPDINGVSKSSKSPQTATPYQISSAIALFSSENRVFTRDSYARSCNLKKHTKNAARRRQPAEVIDVLNNASNYLSNNFKGQHFTLEEWEEHVRVQPKFLEMNDKDRGQTIKAAIDIFNKALALPASVDIKHSIRRTAVSTTGAAR